MKKAIRSMIIFSLILLTTNLLCAQSEQDTELVNLSFQKVNNQIEVQIECKGDISYESFSLIDPNRLVLDFSGINKVSTEPVIEINDVDILSIRTSQFKPGIGRVVFIFADEIPHYKIEETEKGLMVLFWKEK
ncbi:MAG: AMIN domain-containing protein, partial [Candidatus Aminicenantes bacterium]|nr:AMIN domain-containing protein [Candidatus Aminicenantes bacterium]